MRIPRCHIVRVYRRGYQSIAGTVEEAGNGRRTSFRSAAELLAFLHGARTRRDGGEVSATKPATPGD